MYSLLYHFCQEKRGKAYIPKDQTVNMSDCIDEDIHTDFDDILNQATEEELVDLAGMSHITACHRLN